MPEAAMSKQVIVSSKESLHKNERHGEAGMKILSNQPAACYGDCIMKMSEGLAEKMSEGLADWSRPGRRRPPATISAHCPR